MDGEKTISTQLSREQYRLLCLLAELRHCRRADVIQRALSEHFRTTAAGELRGLAAELRPPAPASDASTTRS